MRSPEGNIRLLAPIRLETAYTLADYVDATCDFAPAVVSKRGVFEGERPSRTGRAIKSTLSAMAFWAHRTRTPTCQICIDHRSIKQTNSDETLTVAWNEVVAVHRASQGYLIERMSGVVALPYRCFSAPQAQLFEALVEQKSEWAQPRELGCA